MGYLFHDVHEKQQHVRRDISMGLIMGGNRNNRWDSEGNGTKSWLSMGGKMGMGMNHLSEREWK